MKPLVLSLRHPPEQRLNLSVLTPDRLASLRAAEIERLELQTSRHQVRVGDVFRLRAGDPAAIVIEGGAERLDRVGEAMSSGSILVQGDAGARVGRSMRGGTIEIEGNVGPWAGSGMAGGRLAIGGNAGNWLGGPLAGEMAGMSGGVLAVKGSAGREAGHRLRRGTIAIGKSAGAYAGRSMIAGTLLVSGRAGPLPGYLMRRGTILLGEQPETFSPAFAECGAVELVFTRLLSRALREMKIGGTRFLDRPLCRLAGDLALGGRGEIILPA